MKTTNQAFDFFAISLEPNVMHQKNKTLLHKEQTIWNKISRSKFDFKVMFRVKYQFKFDISILTLVLILNVMFDIIIQLNDVQNRYMDILHSHKPFKIEIISLLLGFYLAKKRDIFSMKIGIIPLYFEDLSCRDKPTMHGGIFNSCYY